MPRAGGGGLKRRLIWEQVEDRGQGSAGERQQTTGLLVTSHAGG